MTNRAIVDQPAPTDAAFAPDERRVVSRLPPNVHTVEVRIIHRGEVIDESSTGIGLIVTSQQGLQAGDLVEVGYAGFPARAEVRHVESTNDGRFRVGLRWVDPFIIRWADPNLLERLADAALTDESP
ncbi:MAG TPA: PilZ domain-containing protein [Pirellulales bacterium]|nr:PilZ domain-containing protein [Pirellulales bacterium]